VVSNGSCGWVRCATIAVLSAIVVGVALFAKWVGPANGMLAYLAIGLFIIACASAGARWLRALPDNAREVPT